MRKPDVAKDEFPGKLCNTTADCIVRLISSLGSTRSRSRMALVYTSWRQGG